MGVVLHEDADGVLIAAGLVTAALLHGAYNFLLGLSFTGAMGALLLSAGLFVFMAALFRRYGASIAGVVGRS